jgi:hypothetical protein
MSCRGVCRRGRLPCPTPGECRDTGPSEVLLIVALSCVFCMTVLGLLMSLL